MHVRDWTLLPAVLGTVSTAFIAGLAIAWSIDDFDLLTRTLGYASLVFWAATLAASPLLRLEPQGRPTERYPTAASVLRARERQRRYVARSATIALALAGAALALFLAALGAAVLPDESNAQAPPSPRLTIDWTVDAPLRVQAPGMPPRTGRPTTIDFEVGDPLHPDCLGGKYTWTFDEKGSADDPAPITRRGVCDAVTGIDPGHPVDVRVTEPDEVGEMTITVRRLLIVSFGDSVAAGEGNPSPGKPRWVGDPKCHRSAFAGPAQAADKVAAAERHAVVTFLHLACTGAWIDGVGAPPKWAKKRASVLPQKRGAHPSELEQFKEEAPAHDGKTIVLLSIGANDLGFSQILKKCASPLVIGNCFGKKLAGIPVRRLIKERFADLETSFDHLAEKPTFMGADVYLTEYFDPLRDEHGNFCHGIKTLTLSSREAQLAEELILGPLNDRLGRRAHNEGWRFVGGISSAFHDHGYCATDSWIVPLLGALAHYNPKGIFHPNDKGQREYGDRIFAALKPHLQVD